MKFILNENLNESYNELFSEIYQDSNRLETHIDKLKLDLEYVYPELDIDYIMNNLEEFPAKLNEEISNTESLLELEEKEYNYKQTDQNESLSEYYYDSSNKDLSKNDDVSSLVRQIKTVRSYITKIKQALGNSSQPVDSRINDYLSACEKSLGNIGNNLVILNKMNEDYEIPNIDTELVLDEEEIEPANPEPGVETGLAGVVMSLIKDEYDAIEGYNGAVATAKDNGYDDLVTIFESIASEELVHVGELQKALEIVSPNAAKIKEGEVEAEEHIGDDDINDDGTLDWGGTEAILKAVDPNGGIINEN